MQKRTIEARSITSENLSKLMLGEIYALRIPNYVSNCTIERILSFVDQHEKLLVNYQHELWEGEVPVLKSYGVFRIGPSLNTIYGTETGSIERKNYFNDAEKASHILRNGCGSEYLTPIDKLRLDLDDLFGCYIPKIDGKQLYSGIIRVMRGGDPNAKILAEDPHIDSIPKDLLNIEGQLSANIYLDFPNVGGELEIWDCPVGFNSDLSGIESFVITPRVGELILINTQRYHAVKTFETGRRISMQTFIGYNGLNSPLVTWN